MGLFSSGFLNRRKKINVKARHTKIWRGRYFGGDNAQDLKQMILRFWMENFAIFVILKGGNCYENRKVGYKKSMVEQLSGLFSFLLLNQRGRFFGSVM
jgi:hypothetical protein